MDDIQKERILLCNVKFWLVVRFWYFIKEAPYIILVKTSTHSKNKPSCENDILTLRTESEEGTANIKLEILPKPVKKRDDCLVVFWLHGTL